MTKGLLPRFGEHRVIDTPISESAIIGAAGGAALAGMRPVAELMFADFIGVCMDQIFNQMAKFRYMFGGKARARRWCASPMGAGLNWRRAAQPVDLPDDDAVPGPQGRDAVERLRRQGPADRRRSATTTR